MSLADTITKEQARIIDNVAILKGSQDIMPSATLLHGDHAELALLPEIGRLQALHFECVIPDTILHTRASAIALVLPVNDTLADGEGVLLVVADYEAASVFYLAVTRADGSVTPGEWETYDLPEDEVVVGNLIAALTAVARGKVDEHVTEIQARLVALKEDSDDG